MLSGIFKKKEVVFGLFVSSFLTFAAIVGVYATQRAQQATSSFAQTVECSDWCAGDDQCYAANGRRPSSGQPCSFAFCATGTSPCCANGVCGSKDIGGGGGQTQMCDNSSQTATYCRGKAVGYDTGVCVCNRTTGTLCACNATSKGACKTTSGQTCKGSWINDSSCPLVDGKRQRCIQSSGGNVGSSPVPTTPSTSPVTGLCRSYTWQLCTRPFVDDATCPPLLDTKAGLRQRCPGTIYSSSLGSVCIVTGTVDAIVKQGDCGCNIAGYETKSCQAGGVWESKPTYCNSKCNPNSSTPPPTGTSCGDSPFGTSCDYKKAGDRCANPDDPHWTCQMAKIDNVDTGGYACTCAYSQ